MARPLHLFLCDSPSPDAGGIQNVAHHLALAFARLGVPAGMAGHMDARTEVLLTRAGVKCFPLSRPFRRKWTADLVLAFLLPRLRRRFGREVVLHSLLINNIRVARLLRPLLPWRLVGYLHGNETLRLLRRRPRVLRGNIAACELVVANSRHTLGLAGRLGPFANLALLSPGIPAGRYADPPDPVYRARRGWTDRRVVLMLSRLQRRKGHGTVIRALAGLLPRHPRLLLAVAGTGRMREAIESQAKEAGLAGHLQMLGRIPEEEKPSFLAAGDVYVMPSEESEEGFEVEGFGITFLEAAAAGTLGIGSATGGIPDALEDGASGLLVPPGDHRALAALIDRVFSAPADFEAIRRHARVRALTEYSWENRARSLLRLLDHGPSVPGASVP
jgi:phosphatidylinositol alpha-1,6-mannosyltransferase